MVSVIVPSYNLELYIGNCLDSLSHQTYSDLEIIVVDDGSTDGTVDVVTKKLQLDSRIKLYVQDNGGAARARNKGFQIAQGEYICFVDGDDMLDIKTIEENLCVLENDSSIDWVAFSIIRTDANGNPISLSGIYGNIIFTEPIVLNAEDFVPAFYYKKLSGVCCGAIYRKSSISDIKFPEGEYYEDGFFFTDLLSITSKGYLSNKGCYFYVHRPGSSQLKKLDREHLESDVRCSTKRLQQYRERFPQYENFYKDWENKLYYFYKNEAVKKTEGADEIFNFFLTKMKHAHDVKYATELKFILYRLFGYKNLQRILQKFCN